MPVITPEESNVKPFPTRVEKSGRQINRAVCEDCSWTYEIESAGDNSLAHHAKAHAAAHSHERRHFVELRCDILGLYIERLVPPRSES